MSPYLAELMGTALLLLLGNGVVANVVLHHTKGNNSGWIVITTGWALAVFVGVVLAGPYSGAHLNPAVTIALATAGKFNWAEVPLFIAMQMLGAMLGTFLVWLNYKDHLNNTPDTGLQRAVFCTEPAIRNVGRNFICEATGTFVLLFTIFYFTNAEVGAEKTPIGLGSLGALPVAFLVWSIGLSLGGTTGYAINPARDLGPRIMYALLPIKGKGHSDWSYAWVPVLGPIAGAALAALLFLSLK
ncbi:MIP/aquaporin family protein [Chitinophaga arvensicola]|uniref:Glycerol uptake facilitator protein n=1 Tax=Chitinophaga arvensicola TaxID=29529 RepID=A0A1I0QWH1_9BACT|nr:MIP/aquaporin family protein [Chitinophaga arvensicola]SEW32111.1 glycerol uptake facilitator protein [Chitinophaga arvensicola]